MLLVSYEFIAFFGLLVLCYYLLPGRFQKYLLLLASYLFFLSGGWKTVVFILVTTMTVWYLGIGMGRIHTICEQEIKEKSLGREEKKACRAAAKKRCWRLLLAGLFLNFGILAVLKYTNFALGTVNGILGAFDYREVFGRVDWLLPMGISYYTFQSMGYLIDVYRKKYEPEKSLLKLSLFVSFFPQLIQGPISRFDQMSEQFSTNHRFCRKEFFFGLERMLWGYAKKLLVADRLAKVVLTVAGDTERFTGAFVLVGMLCYTVQIYADFSGGIDIAIGGAQALGIRLPENFNRPYFSRTVPEYWRRWHMSLMEWFREYIFYPASVCGPVTRFSKWCKTHLGNGAGRRAPFYSATILVWLVTGIWHGASWNFVFWGLLNCVVLLISSELAPVSRRFHERHPAAADSRGFQLMQIGRTLLLLSVIQTLEYYGSVSKMLGMLVSMITDFSLTVFMDGSLLGLGLDGGDWMVAALGALAMLLVSLAQEKGAIRPRIARWPGVCRFLLWFGLFLAVLIFGTYGQGFDASQFIYNQF